MSVIWIEPSIALDTRCPICSLRYGFHDRSLHAALVTIPASLIISKGV
jgi:hypothetical protein